MKLRMQGNSLRLRLTQSEVGALRNKGEVLETVAFGSGAAFKYRLQTRAGGDVAQADLTYGMISISVPTALVERWATSEEVGIYGDDGGLRISVEKDFRCLTRTSEEQEADAYPHPAERCSA